MDSYTLIITCKDRLCEVERSKDIEYLKAQAKEYVNCLAKDGYDSIAIFDNRIAEPIYFCSI